MFSIERGRQGAIDLRIVPILRADVLANYVAGAIDHVGFRNLHGTVAMHYILRGIADGEEIDVIRQQEIAVSLRVLVDADAENLQLRQSMVKGKERRKLLHTRGAPACPERKQHHLTSILAEAERLRAVVKGEGRGHFAQLARKLAAVASGAAR